MPFPVYPVVHEQLKLPGILVHLALTSQLSVPIEHSSMSGIRNKTKDLNK